MTARCSKLSVYAPSCQNLAGNWTSGVKVIGCFQIMVYGGKLMSDSFSDLRHRYQKALQELAKEIRLPESAVTQIIGDLGSGERILNLRGVFAGKRVDHVLDEIIAIAREYDALCGKSPPVEKQSSSHARLLLRLGREWQTEG